MIAVSVHYRKGSRANASAPGSGDHTVRFSSYCSSALNELCPQAQNRKSSKHLQRNGGGRMTVTRAKRSIGVFAVAPSRAAYCRPPTHISPPMAAEEYRGG